MKLDEYTPSDLNTEFWCNICDYNLVTAQKPETGTFYRVFGHTLNNNKISSDYIPVVFAVCKNCEVSNPNRKETR